MIFVGTCLKVSSTQKSWALLLSEEIGVPSFGVVRTVVYWAKIMANFVTSYCVEVCIVDNVNLMPQVSPIRAI